MRPTLLWMVGMWGCADSGPSSGVPESPAEVPSHPTQTIPPDEEPDPGEPLDCQGNLEGRADEVRAILSVACSACHGPESETFDVLDGAALIADGWVVPADAAGSPLYTAVVDGTMPPPSGGGALTTTEIQTVEQWIHCDAEEWSVPPSRGFLAPTIELEAAWNDVSALPIDDPTVPEQQNARYLSLVPLYNAGVSADEIRMVASGVEKVVWSLTTVADPPRLTRVDLDGLVLSDGSVIQVAEDLGDTLLLRVDQRAFRWEDEEVDVWEKIVARYPYAIDYDLPAAVELAEATRSRSPIVHADWFVGNAANDVLYADILELPDTLDGFFAQFGGISATDALATDQAACAGLAVSGFARQNRVMCRYDAVPEGSCRQSFDFLSSLGVDDVFAFPTTFATGRAGGEAFCTLPDGLQVYFVYDADGRRLDGVPYSLATGPIGDDVFNGGSCMACHTEGIVAVTDEIRPYVEANQAAYAPDVVEQVFAWFPESTVLADLDTLDAEPFAAALDALEIGAIEPVSATFANYDENVELVRVAADLGLRSATLGDLLLTNDEVNSQIGVLLSVGHLDRDSFEDDLRDVICAAALGAECDESAFCGQSSVPCPDGSTCDRDHGTCVRD